MAHLEVYRPKQTTRWQRLMQSLRSYTLGPFKSGDKELARYFATGGVSSGVAVSEDTAFGTSAFFAATVMIAWDLASLPLCLFRRLEGGGKERYTAHPLYRLLHDSPNSEQSSFEFRGGLMLSALALGNGFAEIERDAAGRPVALWLLDTHRVTQKRVQGDLVYEYAQPSGGTIVFPARDVLHIKGPSLDGQSGFNTIRVAREALGTAIAAEKFGALYFQHGASLGGILHANGLTPESRENLRKALEYRHTGVDRAHRWMLAPEGSTFTEIGTSPRDSQLLQLREHQVLEIARFLRVPPVLIGSLDRATWGNYSEAKSQYFDQCVRTWCVAIESHLSLKLVRPLERSQQFVEHVTEGFLRADVEKRASFYGSMLDRGVFTINEVRGLENLAPIPGGDTARVPLNFEPLAAAPAKEDEEILQPQGRKAALAAAHRGLLVDAFRRIIRKEVDRARNAASAPTKLRAFTEFYADAHQIATAAATLTPALRAWLAYTNSDTDVAAAAEAIVKKHYADSKEELVKVADLEGGELFQQTLQQVLTRWDTDRATQVVDWLLSRGLTKDGQLVIAPPAAAANNSGAPPARGRIEWLQKWQKNKLTKQEIERQIKLHS